MNENGRTIIVALAAIALAVCIAALVATSAGAAPPEPDALDAELVFLGGEPVQTSRGYDGMKWRYTLSNYGDIELVALGFGCECVTLDEPNVIPLGWFFGYSAETGIDGLQWPRINIPKQNTWLFSVVTYDLHTRWQQYTVIGADGQKKVGFIPAAVCGPTAVEFTPTLPELVKSVYLPIMVK